VTNNLAAALETGKERYRDLATRERRDAEEIREADRSKTTFLSAISHELRTPLMVVDGTAATLRRLGDALSAEDREQLERALATQTSRLSGLLDDLLDLDRLARGSVGSSPEYLDRVEVIREALAEVPGMERVIIDAPMSLTFWMDRTHLSRIVVNLVTNAIKYAPDGPIELHLADDDGALRLVVADHGPGIPLQDRQRVLRPYYRLAHDHPQPGTGAAP